MTLVGENVRQSTCDWKSQQYVLGHLGSAWLIDHPANATDYAQEFATSAINLNPERYDYLADLIYADFCVYAWSGARAIEPRDPLHASPNLAKRSSFTHNIATGEEQEILSGLNTMSTVLSYAPAAYRNVTRGTLQAPSDQARQLGQILSTQQSFDNTVGFLAGLCHDDNQAWEARLGLKPHHRLPAESNPFVIEDTKLGPVFAINQRLTEGLGCQTAQGCPAKDVLLRDLWVHMVEVSVNSAFLFRLDLAGE